MTDATLVPFLAWAVERLGLRWRGVGSFRSTVRKRLTRRLAEVGLGDLAAYRARLENDPSEWAHLEAMCRIPISRLYRDAAVFERLATEILPGRACAAEREGRRTVNLWSAGCASGEEPYTLAMLWHHDVAPTHPAITLEIFATDAEESMLVRARAGAYGAGSVREVPERRRQMALRREGSLFVVREELRRMVHFEQQDLRRTMPDGPFDVVLCRNMLLTYIGEAQQPALLEALVSRVRPGGAFVVGARETMPSSPTVATLPLTAVTSSPGLFVVGRDSARP